MAIYCSRKYHQIIKYFVTCIIMSILIFFSMSFTIQNQSLSYINPFQIYYEKEFFINNHSLASSLTYQIETTKFYPHLPIQIYTKNRQKFLKLKTKTKKVILLANTWFGDPAWEMKSMKNKTNSGNMSELYCSFLNNHCEITYDMTRFKQADAVVIHLVDYFNRSNEILKDRHSSQRFIFALWEPPVNSRDLRSYENYFNWTMSYRFDAHIFTSYYLDGAYRLKTKNWLKNVESDYRSNENKFVLYENINMTQKKGTAAALISNCGEASQNRLLMIAELQKYIDVTIYGKCGHPCPKSILNQTIDCRAYIAEHYYFILSFENSYCQDYITEKLFSAIMLPIIPVVFGRPDYTRFIPQSSFIDFRQFSSLSELANRLNQIRNNVTLYQEYFYWKKQFTWGGFSKFMTPFCDLCLRLHLDKTPNIIANVHNWWFNNTCKPEMWKLIRKIFVDIVFVTILYMVSYTNRDSNAILQVNHLRQFFLNLGNSTYDYTQIISINQYWNWLQMNFISNIRVQSWYNGDPAENMTNYINDKSNRLIGWATMRQLRIGLNANCRVPNIMRSLFNSCKDDYSILNEEQRSFTPGWILSNNKTYSSSIKNAFIYRTSSELNSYIYIGDHATYGSGGYVYEFLGNLNDLQENLTLLRQLSWIDKDSRAVMIQLNLYNPNVNFFTSVTLLIEILNSGGIFPTSDIVPMKTYVEFNNFSSIFYLIIAFIYIIFIIYFTIIEIYSIYKIKKEYFRQIHSYIEWSIIGCSWAGVAVYIWRYSKANRIEKYFHQTNGFQYINLQFAAYVDNVLTFLLGFCCFFGTIRLLRLFKIYPNIHMFFQILNRAFKDIISFSFMFLLLFFAFVFLFYLLFVSKILSYSTILQTIEVLFQMLLLKFNFHDLNNADPFLGPFVFVLFIYFIVFICITMFITIIMHHLRFVRKETRKTEKISPKIFSFIIQDLIKRTGFKKLTKENLQAEYKNPVEQLPEKIDELFAALDKSVMTYTKSEIIQISKSLEISSIPTTNPRGKRRTKKHVIY